MYQLAAVQQTSTVKKPAFFLKYQTEEVVLRVHRSKTTSENTFNGDEFKIEVYHGLRTAEKIYFEYFCRFVFKALTLRLRNTYMYVFGVLFGFWKFQTNSCRFQKLGVSSFSSKLNFQFIDQDYWRLHVLVCCCVASQCSEITSSLVDISNRRGCSKG